MAAGEPVQVNGTRIVPFKLPDLFSGATRQLQDKSAAQGRSRLVLASEHQNRCDGGLPIVVSFAILPPATERRKPRSLQAAVFASYLRGRRVERVVVQHHGVQLRQARVAQRDGRHLVTREVQTNQRQLGQL